MISHREEYFITDTPGLTMRMSLSKLSFMLPELEFVSWQRFHQDSFELAKLLSEKKFDTIVSVSRGGHVLSRVLSDFLSLPIFNVSMKSYKGLENQEVALTQKLGQYLGGQRILLVDEIVDTCNTLARA